jgi:DNA-binding CsgD family transcriptional regulator
MPVLFLRRAPSKGPQISGIGKAEHMARHADAQPGSTISSSPRKPRQGTGRRESDRYTEAAAAMGRWAVNRHSKPMLLVDDDLKALFVNKAAEELARNRQILRWARRTKKVSLRDAGLQAALDGLIKEARNRRPLVVRMRNPDADLEVSCLEWPWPKGCVYVISLAGRQTEAVDGSLLEKNYKLTPTEAEIAIAIFNGHAPSLIAKQRDVVRDTVKSHLTQIYRKLNVQSQIALVRRVSEVLQEEKSAGGGGP